MDRILELEKQIITEYLLKKIFYNKKKESETIILINHFIDLEEQTDKFILELNDYKKIKSGVDKFILDLLKKDNRIETKKLFSEFNIGKKEKSQIPTKIIIDNYRKKAFHNGLPESGTFEDGIKILNQHIN